MSIIRWVIGEEAIAEKWEELRNERAKYTRAYCVEHIRAHLRRRFPNRNTDELFVEYAEGIERAAAELYGHFCGQMDAKETFLNSL